MENKVQSLLKITPIIFLTFFMSCFHSTSFSQCAGGVLGGAITPAPTAAYQTMAVNSNRYYTFVVAPGCLPTYDFSFCAADGGSSAFDSQITILDNTGAYANGYQDDFCGSAAHLVWTPTVAGTYRVLINVFNCATTVSAATLAYKITTPPNMTYTSASSVDIALGGNSERCEIAVPMTRVEVVMGGGSCNLLSLTQLNVNMTGTSGIGAVDKVHVYYTGTSATFASTNEFVAGGLSPLASLTFNDTRTLATGTNYFWVVYDLNNTGTIGNTIGARLPAVNALTVVTPRNPAANPNCLKTFIACAAYPNSTSLWLKGNAGTNTTVDGALVSSWNSQAVAPIVSVTQATPALQPTYREGSGTGVLNRFNYNPSLYTDGTSNRLIQTGDINLGTTATGFSVYQVIGEDNGIVSMDWYHTANGNIKVKGDALMYICKADGTVEQNVYNANGQQTVQAYLQSVRGVPGAVSGNGKLNGLTGAGYGNGWRVAAQNGICIGSNLDNGEFMQGGMGEFIIFPSILNASLNLRVESYLAIKYGISLGTTAAPSNYLSSDGTIIWAGNSTYQNNIIGIGRDNAAGSSLLLQKQSHYYSDLVRLYKGALATTNNNNVSTFALNKSFVIAGDNVGSMCATAASLLEMPAGCGLYSRLEREWRVTRTNMAETFNMDIKLAACGAPGSVAVADLRLLVDDDGNFSNGGTTCYFNGDGTGVVISYSNPTITVSNINIANHIPNNSTRFITIGSVNSATPLPVELITFDATLNQKRTVDLTWTTATEYNSHYFIVEKSLDLMNWENNCFIEAAGNSSTSLDYACEDVNPFLGLNYYRLKQVDLDGSYSYSETRVVNLESTQEVAIYPNPTNSNFSIQVKNIESKEIRFFNAMGQEVDLQKVASSNDMYQFETDHLSDGMYYIQVTSGLESTTYKLIVLKNK